MERLITHDRETRSMSEWSRMLGISYQSFLFRYKMFLEGKFTEEMVFHKGKIGKIDYRDANTISHDGVAHTCSEWSRLLGIKPHTMLNRIERFRKGKLSEAQCFSVGRLGQVNKTIVDVEGKRYTLEGLARRLGIKVETARRRYKMFKSGKCGIDTLMTKGTICVRDRKVIRNKRFELSDGTRVSSCDLATAAEVSRSTIKAMLDSGKSADEIVQWVNDPNRHVHGNCWVNGKKERIEDVVSHLGLSYGCIYARFQRGWSLKDAVSENKVSVAESTRRGRSARMRNLRLAELRKMGIVV